MACLKPFEQLAKFAASQCRQVPGYQPMKLPSKFDNIVIAMSSGVDSSVAAAMFSGFPNACGIYMQNWTETRSEREPCHERDWKDVQKVGAHLNLPVEKVNFEQDYWLDVFEPMLRDYEQGVTPNPDIGCNRFIKFGKLRAHLDASLGTGNYWLVTGHYSRVLQTESKALGLNSWHLLRAFYAPKDQSYYLSQVPSAALPALCLPMGVLTKPEVREMAHDLRLPTAHKPDSQGICFVANSQHGKISRFLEQYIPSHAGEIITLDPITGERTEWGRHTGLWNYTIGQKVGISMPQGDPRYQGAWFVADKRVDTNEIVICKGRDNPSLYKNRVVLKDFSPLGNLNDVQEAVKNNLAGGAIHIQYRSLQEPAKVSRCCWETTEAGESRLVMTLEQKQRAMAPGQYCTIYHKERILGSGTILASDAVEANK
ncbi:tRNA-5-taurinomethyluridine 2-sulfurtransferase [Lachancea thermotolerans CBS 6340]|uniref:tRNA-5-taurinomethyluridine 2-sulfurtransferase n=1 Tax=Lachancea thermotolerans (strain ATCC 56472 / CBS 6340 / NRRL Y-8284) TaxID=559295 RepID=C5DEF9_LACTC|nr:KLTH0C08844p [Lachancea thermotolerans CBS 6340]CAR22170.1 KLTH0C08844p [Lachancea thermotolerans CBS 6340]